MTDHQPLDLEHMFAFERDWEEQRGAKSADCRARFGVSFARYTQVLHRLLDTREALEEDPILTNRLNRLRNSRTEARATRTTYRQPTGERS